MAEALFRHPAIQSSKHVIQLLDRAYSARPLADRLLNYAPQPKP
jgi:hypothetical protein